MALVDVLLHLLDRCCDVCGCEVAEYACGSLCTSTLECLSCIVVAVCTNECGQVNDRLLNGSTCVLDCLLLGLALASCATLYAAVGIDLAELLRVNLLQSVNAELLAVECNLGSLYGLTDNLGSVEREILRSLNNE